MNIVKIPADATEIRRLFKSLTITMPDAYFSLMLSGIINLKLKFRPIL